METLSLRRELAALAAKPDWDFLVRHDLQAKKMPRSRKERVRRRVRWFLAAMGLVPPHVTQYPWRPTLKHSPVAVDAETLLIWAVGVARDELRLACKGFLSRLAGNGSWAPVLVTDVADFSYFSRLGWLVEYLPELNGEGESYRDRKCRYLAWRYRHAMIVPVSAGLASNMEWRELLEAGCK